MKDDQVTKAIPKTEEELIETVKTLNLEQCRLFAERAAKRGFIKLEAACNARIVELKPPSSKRDQPKDKGPMKTHKAAELALDALISDYQANLPPTTYRELAKRGGYEPAIWFGQVTDMMDAACALNDIPSFALVRVREVGGEINKDAWKKNYSHLRDKIISRALNANWSDADFVKIKDTIGLFIASGLGNKKAWDYVFARIDLEKWASG